MAAELFTQKGHLTRHVNMVQSGAPAQMPNRRLQQDPSPENMRQHLDSTPFTRMSDPFAWRVHALTSRSRFTWTSISVRVYLKAAFVPMHP
jgi:hypothetical protein